MMDELEIVWKAAVVAVVSFVGDTEKNREGP